MCLECSRILAHPLFCPFFHDCSKTVFLGLPFTLAAALGELAFLGSAKNLVPRDDSSQRAAPRHLLSSSLLRDQGNIQILWSETERLKAVSRGSHWRCLSACEEPYLFLPDPLQQSIPEQWSVLLPPLWQMRKQLIGHPKSLAPVFLCWRHPRLTHESLISLRSPLPTLSLPVPLLQAQSVEEAEIWVTVKEHQLASSSLHRIRFNRRQDCSCLLPLSFIKTMPN